MRRIEESSASTSRSSTDRPSVPPCSPTHCRPTTPEDKGLTVGPPLPHTELRIVDPVSLETVPIGASGELWARGYFTMLGYFEKPEESAPDVGADGWLRTGDWRQWMSGATAG